MCKDIMSLLTVAEIVDAKANQLERGQKLDPNSVEARWCLWALRMYENLLDEYRYLNKMDSDMLRQLLPTTSEQFKVFIHEILASR